jgi:hypothetical protein
LRFLPIQNNSKNDYKNLFFHFHYSVGSPPLNYLPLLEQKVVALDQAAPLKGWELPEVFLLLRRLLESRAGKKGKREYISFSGYWKTLISK